MDLSSIYPQLLSKASIYLVKLAVLSWQLVRITIKVSVSWYVWGDSPQIKQGVWFTAGSSLRWVIADFPTLILMFSAEPNIKLCYLLSTILLTHISSTILLILLRNCHRLLIFAHFYHLASCSWSSIQAKPDSYSLSRAITTVLSSNLQVLIRCITLILV